MFLFCFADEALVIPIIYSLILFYSTEDILVADSCSPSRLLDCTGLARALSKATWAMCRFLVLQVEARLCTWRADVPVLSWAG
jgi:hypothetical protein